MLMFHPIRSVLKRDQRLLVRPLFAGVMISIVAPTCALLTSCGTGSGSSSHLPSGPANLTINISGVPSGATASVIVTGPAGFNQTISQTTTLSDLTPGTYTLAAPILSPSSTSLTVPVYSPNPATVTAGANATASISYGALPLTWTSIGPRHVYTSFLSGTYGAGQISAIAVNNSNSSTI